MNGRSIILGSVVSLVTAATSLGLIYCFPDGQVAETQLALLIGAVSVGTLVAFRFASPTTMSGALFSLWPVAVVCVAMCVVVLAGVVPAPIVQSAAKDIESRVPRDCELILQNWPDQPTLGDYRKLEWTIREAEASLRTISQRLDQSGLNSDRYRLLVDRQLQLSFTPATIKSRVQQQIPIESKQQLRIHQRLVIVSDQLIETAKEIGLTTIVEWAAHVHDRVAELLPKEGDPS